MISGRPMQRQEAMSAHFLVISDIAIPLAPQIHFLSFPRLIVHFGFGGKLNLQSLNVVRHYTLYDLVLLLLISESPLVEMMIEVFGIVHGFLKNV